MKYTNTPNSQLDYLAILLQLNVASTYGSFRIVDEKELAIYVFARFIVHWLTKIAQLAEMLTTESGLYGRDKSCTTTFQCT